MEHLLLSFFEEKAIILMHELSEKVAGQELFGRKQQYFNKDEPPGGKPVKSRPGRSGIPQGTALRKETGIGRRL